ncbi:MAG: exonuclease subunit SbcD, partial [Shewanellaceae bacterium]|nr:exonuclease subunit SbcD [Shewanellaceae bacterium]
MKILHTSDWHLGQYFHKQKNREAEHAQFIEWLLEQVVLHQIDAVILAGDVFDTGSPPSYARQLYAHFIGQMHRLGCQLIVLAGNHDSVAMLEESKPLMATLQVQVITDVSPTDVASQVVVLRNRDGEPGAVVMAIPFLRPQSLVTSAAGETASTKQANLQQAITAHYAQTYAAAQQVQQGLDQPVPIVATGHLTACNIQASGSEREIYIGTLAAFPAAGFPPAAYIALGHIHRPQCVAQQQHIRYCGSPIPLSFDEIKHDK